MNDLMLKVDHVSKRYRLGQIGGTTLKEELQRFSARLRHREDPTRKIGAQTYDADQTLLALNDVSFEVKTGERVGLIGRNGAGKSTLLKLISRITAPTSGTIGLNGRVASMLEVGTGFHWELTGRENIYMNGAILGMSKREIDDKLEDIIEFSECRNFIDTPVKRYSSGMYVKLGFSVAAHLNSEIMIMDEVLAVGDMAYRQKCLERMMEESKNRGRTILYVSHNMDTIRQLCNRCILLEQGSLVFDGEVEKGISLYSNPASNGGLTIDYSGKKLPDWLKNPKVLVRKASLLDKNSNIYSPGEEIPFQLEWENLQDTGSLGLRVEIRSISGVRIGATLAMDFYEGSKGSISSARLTIAPHGLVSGIYHLVFVFCQADASGNLTNVGYAAGPTIEIKKEDDLYWETHHWGNIRFDDLKVTALDTQ